jgi:transcriptional regulator with GAF, ATPase, and Fis domain
MSTHELSHLRRRDPTVVLSNRALPALVRPKLRLEVLEGPDRGQSAVADQRIVHVGSQPGVTLQLHDDAVSRIHLEVTNESEGLRLRDLGSTNGCWLEGDVRVVEAHMRRSAVVVLGRSKISLQQLDEKVSESLSPLPSYGDLIGISAPMRAIFALLERVAPTDETVLITGETGTGKELCARSVVQNSPRRDEQLVVVDCGAVPPSLLESELFGHVRGAFTNAVSDYAGAFERADRGTLFLDEIGELPLECQSRLLRAVENRTVRPIGGTRAIPLDIRIIAATNRRLEEEVNRGSFRADLYYRLSVVQVRIPPLRERPEDLQPLAQHLLRDLGAEQRSPLDGATLDRLRRYSWPGNVRELRNYLRRLAFDVNAQPEVLVPQRDTRAPEVDLSQPFKKAKEGAVAQFERAYLTALLEKTAGNISQAARIAQTDRTYLSRLLVRHKIQR